MTDYFADLTVPGPTVTALTEEFWQAADRGELLIQRCTYCGAANFYPRALCTACWHDELVWENASGKAHLKSFSEVHRPGHPAWAAVAPYVVGLAELAEGPTMLSLILPNQHPIRVGAELRLAPTMVGERRLPAFELV
ncbi:MAG: zinc ribbon domain-containing protein [Pseudomonadota bacterium]